MIKMPEKENELLQEWNKRLKERQSPYTYMKITLKGLYAIKEITESAYITILDRLSIIEKAEKAKAKAKKEKKR
jgi:hypothetical protein